MLFGAASFLGFIPYIIVFMIKSFEVLCSIIVIATQFFGISALCQISKHCLKIIQNVALCHFPPFLVHLKVTCLVTLFWPLAILMNFSQLDSLAMLNETFSMIFKHCVVLVGQQESRKNTEWREEKKGFSHASSQSKELNDKYIFRTLYRKANPRSTTLDIFARK